MFVLKSFLRHNQFLQQNRKTSFPVQSTTPAVAGKRLSTPLLVTTAVAAERVDLTRGIAIQTEPGRDIPEDERGAGGTDGPLLVTAAVAAKRVDLTRGIAVQTEAGCDVLVRLRVHSNGRHGDRQDGGDNGEPAEGKAPYRFVHSSLVCFQSTEFPNEGYE